MLFINRELRCPNGPRAFARDRTLGKIPPTHPLLCSGGGGVAEVPGPGQLWNCQLREDVTKCMWVSRSRCCSEDTSRVLPLKLNVGLARETADFTTAPASHLAGDCQISHLKICEQQPHRFLARSTKSTMIEDETVMLPQELLEQF